ncbi:MAG: hypothetical protein R3248_09230 [Candidatus Promineifilaceae bacterium]|nr:hypothetical protein [Candidatus Promineifilaceae bacterium]
MFPSEFPLFRFMYWLINTAGLGGIAALVLGGGSLTAYFLTLRWIIRGGEADEVQTYTYPTHTLLEHDEE